MGWDPRHSFAPTRPARRVANARSTGRLVFYIQIYVWPPNSSPGPPVHAAYRDPELLEGPLTLVFTHHTRPLRRAHTQYRSFGLLLPDTSMATRIRARIANAR